MNRLKQNPVVEIIGVLLLSLLLGAIMNALHIMLPWMFGPILASFICIKGFKMKLNAWPNVLSNIGLIFLGIQIGASFTKNVIKDIQYDWFFIIFVTIAILVMAFIIAVGFKKISKVNFETALLSVVPGAISQMLVMAEENKKANLLVVSLTQTSRMLFVVFLVPLFSYFFQDKSQKAHAFSTAKPLTQVLNIPDILILGISITVVYFIMKYIKFPTRYLLAPIAVLIVWNLMTGISFTVDSWMIALAQVLYMIRIGIQISKLVGQLHGKIALGIAFQNVMLILGSILLVFGINFVSHQGLNQLFLSAAPGGMTQIVLIAFATHADVAMISSYHIFRIFFILFLITPIIHYVMQSNQRFVKKLKVMLN